ncbi:nose resistant to fluoxetine protein 6-like [Oppia nitens]|uniref:nose resistant to fluoxetine protein 6-like n=1 Tax=Oppia nitens TaxID=1686743 RepID=UPI0023DA7ECA|nr:nose resistant to fluoxetine protein 6-like [Oppia nitens]
MLGTIIDWQFGSLVSSNKWIQLLVAFSLYTNTRQLLTVGKQPINTITCFNGLRVICLLIIIFSHIIDTSHSFVMNVNEVFRLQSSFMMQFVTNVELWVDIFLLLSGFLCAYSVINDTKQTTISKYVGNIFRKIIHRYIRLTPSLLAMIGFSKLLEVMASGPLWFQYLYQSQSTSWWTNLIYLNNIIQSGQTDIYSCISHTWYLAVDMQMFIVSNIFIILLAFNDIRKQYLGIAINIGLILVAWTAIAIKIIFYGYPPTDFKYMNTAPIFNEIFFSTYCRLPPYCVGILMAYIYNKFGKINIKWQINILLWILCIGINVAIVSTTYFWYLGYSYNNFLSVLYGSTHRTVWAICWSYMLYACATGQGGIVNRVLSWPALVPLSRLSFHTYLFHYPLLLLITFSARQPTYLDPLNLVIIC